VNRPAAAMSEKALESGVRRILADLPGVLAYHTHDSRRSHAGFPDWVLAGRGGVLWRELKRENGRLADAQAEWLGMLAECREDAGVWRPSDLLDGTVARELAALAYARQVTT
jgi:hypothetical protein